MARITLLEDETELREEIAAYLTGQGHQVASVGCLEAFAEPMARSDIAIIDVMLPSGSGFDAVTSMRTALPQAGIIMMTARSHTQDKLRGLNGGADHYLVKPVKLPELGAVINALCRRVVSHWRMDALRQCLCTPQGIEMALTTKEAHLLEALARQPGKTLSRQVLVEAMGHDWLSYDERRLDTLISRLRKRWREQTGTELPLRTEHREGFSFSELLTL